jgi:hypothetical protein
VAEGNGETVDKELLRFQKACEEARKYRANFRRNFAVIKPAIGFLNKDGVKKFYFVLWFPSEKFESPDQEYGGVLMGPKPWIVTSNGEGRGEIILWHRENLISERIWPESDIDYFDLRWEPEDFWDYWQTGEAPAAREVFDEIVALLKQYVEYQNEAHYAITALWIIGTYLQPFFKTYPYLYYHGEKGVGKTKTLNIIGLLAFNAVNSLSVTASSLFRICQSSAATLLIDETGYLKNKQRYEELRTLLYGRYKAGQSVQRTDKESGKVQKFRVFGPTALASIEWLEDVLADRVIEIIILRSLNPLILDKEVNDYDPVWGFLRNKLYRLAHRRWLEFEPLSTSCVGCANCELTGDRVLSGRAAELWRPLLLLAKWVGEDVHRLVLNYAVEYEKVKREGEKSSSNNLTLLQTLLKLVDRDDYYFIKHIREKMVEEMNEGAPSWLTNEWVSRTLKRFGFVERRRVSKGTQIHLTPNQVKDVAARFCIIPPSSPVASQLAQPTQLVENQTPSSEVEQQTSSADTSTPTQPLTPTSATPSKAEEAQPAPPTTPQPEDQTEQPKSGYTLFICRCGFKAATKADFEAHRKRGCKMLEAK